eukprot:TRINITY_DN58055_c0_g1_i1.p1 TRINITY_DN58055_c0_g1~~TRINITY_DN58055_c0_g1_i1.p1  ORF type:complete len:325 (-),score=33.00 TRINITY_DN58055_c0_g1_i1:279-1193(-)
MAEILRKCCPLVLPFPAYAFAGVLISMAISGTINGIVAWDMYRPDAYETDTNLFQAFPNTVFGDLIVTTFIQTLITVLLSTSLAMTDREKQFPIKVSRPPTRALFAWWPQPHALLGPYYNSDQFTADEHSTSSGVAAPPGGDAVVEAPCRPTEDVLPEARTIPAEVFTDDATASRPDTEKAGSSKAAVDVTSVSRNGSARSWRWGDSYDPYVVPARDRLLGQLRAAALLGLVSQLVFTVPVTLCCLVFVEILQDVEDWEQWRLTWMKVVAFCLHQAGLQFGIMWHAMIETRPSRASPGSFVMSI